MSVRVSLRGMLKLNRVDTLRRVHNVGFLAGRLNYVNLSEACYKMIIITVYKSFQIVNVYKL